MIYVGVNALADLADDEVQNGQHAGHGLGLRRICDNFSVAAYQIGLRVGKAGGRPHDAEDDVFIGDRHDHATDNLPGFVKERRRRHQLIFQGSILLAAEPLHFCIEVARSRREKGLVGEDSNPHPASPWRE